MPLLTLTKKEAPSPSAIDPQELLSEIRALEKQLKYNEALFNIVTESDLMDAIIYENLALQCRYRHYLALARECSISESLAAKKEESRLLAGKR